MPKKTLILRLDDNADEARLRELIAGEEGVSLEAAEELSMNDERPSLAAFQAQMADSDHWHALSEGERQGVLAGYRDLLAGQTVSMDEAHRKIRERLTSSTRTRGASD